MSDDYGTAYADLVAGATSLASGLDEAQLATRVPATPAWTVRDVVSHLAGVPADQVAGRMEGAPSPEWSAAQVRERSDRSLEEVLAELQGNVGAVQDFLRGRPTAGLVWDASTHLSDLHEALGLGRPDESLWRPAYEDARAFVLEDRADAFDHIDDYEVFRVMFARRSRGQMRALGTGLSDEDLDDVPVFGPRDDDQPVPPA